MNQAVLPWNVMVAPFSRTHPDSKEAVLTPDSEKRTIVVEGYLAHSDAIAFEDQWPLRTAKASEPTEHLYRSNLEMGIDLYSQE